MNIKQLSNELNKLLGLRDKKLAEACVRATLQLIRTEVSKKEKVTLEGFGTFYPKPFKRSSAWNYKTKEYFTPDVLFTPGFKATKEWHNKMKVEHRMPYEQYMETLNKEEDNKEEK